MRIEFTSTDGSWLIAISVSSQAANTSGASPAGRKREADGDGGKKSMHSLPPCPPHPPFLYFLLYHYSCLLASLCYVSYQLPYRHHRARSKQYVLMAYRKKQPTYFKRPQSGALRYRGQQVKNQTSDVLAPFQNPVSCLPS